MGIDSFFKHELRERFPGAFPANVDRLYDTCCIDVEQLVFAKPADSRTGEALVEFCLRTAARWVDHSRSGRCRATKVVMMFDEEDCVTRAKDPCHATRDGKRPRPTGALEPTEDEEQREEGEIPAIPTHGDTRLEQAQGDRDGDFETLPEDWYGFLADRRRRRRLMNWLACALRALAWSLDWVNLVVDDGSQIGECDFKGHRHWSGGSDTLIISTDVDVLLFELMCRDVEPVAEAGRRRLFICLGKKPVRVPMTRADVRLATTFICLHRNEKPDFEKAARTIDERGDQELDGRAFEKVARVAEFVDVEALWGALRDSMPDVRNPAAHFSFIALMCGSDLVMAPCAGPTIPSIGAGFAFKTWETNREVIGPMVKLGDAAEDRPRSVMLNPTSVWRWLRLAYANKMATRIARPNSRAIPGYTELVRLERQLYPGRRRPMHDVRTMTMIILAARFALGYYANGHLGTASTINPFEVHPRSGRPLHAWVRGPTGLAVHNDGTPVHDEERMAKLADAIFPRDREPESRRRPISDRPTELDQAEDGQRRRQPLKRLRRRPALVRPEAKQEHESVGPIAHDRHAGQ
jgi:hypothetical protein